MKKWAVIRSQEIKEILKTPVQKGKRQLEPLKSRFLAGEIPFGIMEDSEVGETEAEVHKNQGDLWFCLEGQADFICGGELIDSRIGDNSSGHELYGPGIQGGEKITLYSGDWLWIPAGVPHVHRASKIARLIIIKIPFFSALC